MADLALLESLDVIDADTHLTEPIDLWTSQISTKRWGDEVLQVHPDQDGKLSWYIGDWKAGMAPGAGASAAWVRNNPDYLPAVPLSFDDILEGAYKADARLEWMDDSGIYAQVVYPNVAGFAAGALLHIESDELRLLHVQAYNNFLTEWAKPAKGRLIPIALIPFWDIQAARREMRRIKGLGVRGILFPNMPETFGADFPVLSHDHWYPIWAEAQELDLSVNFHIGSGMRDRDKEAKTYKGDAAFGPAVTAYAGNGPHANHVRQGVLLFLDNSRAVTELLISAVPHKFPDLKFVSVESGAGWIPFVCEALDWQWVASGGASEHPEYELKPSECFKRSWYACFWFERYGIKAMLDYAPDNVMFETDFPHPTSLTPGPLSPAEKAKFHIQKTFKDIPNELARKALQDNGAKLYKVDLPRAARAK